MVLPSTTSSSLRSCQFTPLETGAGGGEYGGWYWLVATCCNPVTNWSESVRSSVAVLPRAHGRGSVSGTRHSGGVLVAVIGVAVGETVGAVGSGCTSGILSLSLVNGEGEAFGERRHQVEGAEFSRKTMVFLNRLAGPATYHRGPLI